MGPVLSVPIPLFDQGQARVGRAVAELRRAQQEYYALAVRIRATARAVRDRMRGAQDRALYYRDILLPLQERIVNEAQLQYNAMQIGIFQLLARPRAADRDRRRLRRGASGVLVGAGRPAAQIASGRLPGIERGSAGRWADREQAEHRRRV